MAKPTWKPITAAELTKLKRKGHIRASATICPSCGWRLGDYGSYCAECQKSAAEAPTPVTIPAARPRSKREREKAAFAHLAEVWGPEMRRIEQGQGVRK